MSFLPFIRSMNAYYSNNSKTSENGCFNASGNAMLNVNPSFTFISFNVKTCLVSCPLSRVISFFTPCISWARNPSSLSWYRIQNLIFSSFLQSRFLYTHPSNRCNSNHFIRLTQLYSLNSLFPSSEKKKTHKIHRQVHMYTTDTSVSGQAIQLLAGGGSSCRLQFIFTLMLTLLCIVTLFVFNTTPVAQEKEMQWIALFYHALLFHLFLYCIFCFLCYHQIPYFFVWLFLPVILFFPPKKIQSPRFILDQVLHQFFTSLFSLKAVPNFAVISPTTLSFRPRVAFLPFHVRL